MNKSKFKKESAITFIRLLFFSVLFTYSTFAKGSEKLEITESLKDLPVFNKEVFEKLYYVDEWAFSPNANQKKFILLHFSDTTMKIFDNKELQGHPVFLISASKFFPFDSNLLKDPNSGLSPNTCFNSGLESNKRIKTWIECKMTPCERVSVSKPIELKLVSPHPSGWYLAHEWKHKTSCPFGIPFLPYIENLGSKYSVKEYLYLEPTEINLNFVKFEMGNKSYYLDIKGISRIKNDGPFLIDNWSKPLNFSDYEMRWHYMKTAQADIDPIFISKIRDCSTRSDIQCLRNLTFSASEFNSSSDTGIHASKLNTLEWTDSNLKELSACLEDGKKHPHGIIGLYIGIEKKCLFAKAKSGFKLVTIDLPEAFSIEPLGNTKFEVKD